MFNYIDDLYNSIEQALVSRAKLFVRERRKGFYKFWWDQGLDTLKEASLEANQIWKAPDKPRHGPIFDKRQSTRLQYPQARKTGSEDELWVLHKWAPYRTVKKKLSWCWQTSATHLEVSQGHQT